MSSKKYISGFLLLSLIAVGIISCSQEADSRPNFIFKPAPSQGAAIKVAGQVVTEAELYKGAESDIFEAELKVNEIKMNKVQAYILEKFMQMDPRKKGISNDEFLEKYIAAEKNPTEKDVDRLIQERSIPQEHITPQMRDKIKKYLAMEAKRGAIDDWINQQTKKNPVEVYIAKPKWPVFDINTENSPFVGKADAKVTLVEYSDFQCPFCARGSQIVGEIKKKYKDKVKIVFKNFPLPFHKQAKTAALAGLCANEQGMDKFWKMHDKMFSDQAKLNVDDLKASAKSLGMNAQKFNECLDANKYLSQIDQDIASAEKVEVKSTPTFFVNGKIVQGAREVEFFSELIDEELAK